MNSVTPLKHSHNFSQTSKKSERKVYFVFVLTAVVMVLEISAGIWSGSMALLADGWHMGTHAAAFLITLFAYAYARKHAEGTRYSFGTGKVNYLGGFASAVALAIVAIIMAFESFDRLIDARAIHFNEAIWVAFLGLTVNIASVFVLHDDHHHNHNGHHHDHNMKAAYFHVLADTLTSVLAIVALFSGKYFGWIWMDAMMGLVGSIVIGRWSYGLIKESAAVLLDKTVDEQCIQPLAKQLESECDAVLQDIHIWQVASGCHAAILSIQPRHPKPRATYEHCLRSFYPDIVHLTIEIIES